jgi:hypothetical protein
MKSFIEKLVFLISNLLISALSFDYFHNHTSRYILPVLQKHYGYFSGNEVVEKLGLFKTWYYELYYQFVSLTKLPFDRYFSMLSFVLIIKSLVFLFILQLPKANRVVKSSIALFVAVGSDGFIGSDYIFPNANYHALIAHALIFMTLLFLVFPFQKGTKNIILISLINGLAVFFHGVSFILSLPFIALVLIFSKDLVFYQKAALVIIQLGFIFLYRAYLGDTVFNSPETSELAKEIFLRHKGNMVHNSLRQNMLEWAYFGAICLLGPFYMYWQRRNWKFPVLFFLLVFAFIGIQWIADITNHFTLNYLQLMRFSIWAKASLFLMLMKSVRQSNIGLLVLTGLFIASGYAFLFLLFYLITQLVLDVLSANSSVWATKLRKSIGLIIVLSYLLMVLMSFNTNFFNTMALLSLPLVLTIVFIVLLNVSDIRILNLSRRVLFIVLFSCISLPQILQTRQKRIELSSIREFPKGSWMEMRFKKIAVKANVHIPSALVWVDPIFYSQQKVEMEPFEIDSSN